jgi:SnoaL-like domain
MEHPNAERLRAAWTAIEDGEYALVTEMLRPDVRWINDIGAGPYGAANGIDEVFTLLGQWNELFEGSFHRDIIDVCGSDDNVVAILHEMGTAAGQRFDNLALYRFELDTAGQISSVRTYDRDREAIEQFWAAVDTGSPGAT